MEKERRTKIKILQVLGALEVGGLQNVVLEVIKNIDKRNFKVDVCEMFHEQGSLSDQARSLGANVYQCSLRENPFTFSRRFSHLIKEGGYDIVEVAREWMSGLPIQLAAKCGVPVRITHFHSMAHVQASMFSRLIYKLNRRKIERYSTHIAGCSRSVLDYNFGSNWGNDDRFLPLYNMVDLDKFNVPDSIRVQIREKFSIPENAYVAGTCARLHKVKNPMLCVELAKRIIQVIPEFYYLWIGDGEERASVEQAVKQCGLSERFIITGQREDVPELLQGLDIYIMLSKWEGLPISVIEAQASGLPCVVSDAKAFEEALCPEMHGYKFDISKGLGEIVNAIEFLRDNRIEYNRLKICGKEYVEKFGISQVMKELESFYISSLAG